MKSAAVVRGALSGRDESGAPRKRGRSIRLPSALLGPLGRLGAHALDLAAWQGDEDFADPLRLYPVDRLGVEADQVHLGGRFSLLDGLQVALPALQPHHGLLAIEARNRMALVLVDHDNVAVF